MIYASFPHSQIASRVSVRSPYKLPQPRKLNLKANSRRKKAIPANADLGPHTNQIQEPHSVNSACASGDHNMRGVETNGLRRGERSTKRQGDAEDSKFTGTVGVKPTKQLWRVESAPSIIFHFWALKSFQVRATAASVDRTSPTAVSLITWDKCKCKWRSLDGAYCMGNTSFFLS